MKSNKNFLNQIWAIVLLAFMVAYFFATALFHLKLVLLFLFVWFVVWLLINLK